MRTLFTECSWTYAKGSRDNLRIHKFLRIFLHKYVLLEITHTSFFKGHMPHPTPPSHSNSSGLHASGHHAPPSVEFLALLLHTCTREQPKEPIYTNGKRSKRHVHMRIKAANRPREQGSNIWPHFFGPLSSFLCYDLLIFKLSSLAMENGSCSVSPLRVLRLIPARSSLTALVNLLLEHVHENHNSPAERTLPVHMPPG